MNIPYPLLTLTTTSSGKNDSLEPGKHFILGVTITNEDADRTLDVDIALEDLPPDLTLSSQPMRPRLALFPGQSEEVTFRLQASTMALPRVITYSLVVTDPNQSAPDRKVIERAQRHLRILPIDRTKHPIESPTFYLEPTTSSSQPQPIQPLAGIPIQVWVDNRSDLVDRLRLQCDGLPKGWEVAIAYPQDALGLGLMTAATSLGLNPGDRGQILLTIKPPVHAHAGVYVPTLRLTSENQPGLKLMHLLYLEVPPNYLLQPSLQNLRSQFRQGSALFELQLANNGNTPREVEVAIASLDESDRYTYQLAKSSIQVLPQTTQTVGLEVHPKQKWRRPLYGSGHFSNFRVQLQDQESYPLTPATLQGSFTWLPRPWWQLLLGVLIILGLVGGAAGMLWWFLLRPLSPPKVLSFEPDATNYSVINEEFAKVNFAVRHPERIQSIRLTGYDLEGKVLSDSIAYDFQDEANPDGLTNESLPHGLKGLCNLQARQALLTCHQVHTGASLPGTYVFELAVLYEQKGRDVTLTEQSSNVIIEPVPAPVVRAERSFYLESSNALNIANPPSPLSNGLVDITDENFSLFIEVFQPHLFEAIKLVGKTQEGDIFGEEFYPIWSSEEVDKVEDKSLHPDFEANGICQLPDKKIVCSNFSTQLRQINTFKIEAILIPNENNPVQEPVTIITEPITIHPAPVAIDRFTINGENAKPKYQIPIDQTDFNPESSSPPGVYFNWAVSGGSTMKVELLSPNPEILSPSGSQFFPLATGESITITLQVTDGKDETQVRSVEITAVDPTPTDPEDVAAAAATAAIEAMQAAEQANTPGDENSFGVPNSVDPEQASPSEKPPQFNP